jgi:hypothetical protein
MVVKTPIITAILGRKDDDNVCVPTEGLSPPLSGCVGLMGGDPNGPTYRRK